jgi:hypothetical protein
MHRRQRPNWSFILSLLERIVFIVALLLFAIALLVLGLVVLGELFMRALTAIIES